MREATARLEPNASSAGALALGVLSAQQFIMAYDPLTERAGCNLSSTRHEAVVRRT
jgi:hypothetical protein